MRLPPGTSALTVAVASAVVQHPHGSGHHPLWTKQGRGVGTLAPGQRGAPRDQGCEQRPSRSQEVGEQSSGGLREEEAWEGRLLGAETVEQALRTQWS